MKNSIFKLHGRYLLSAILLLSFGMSGCEKDHYAPRPFCGTPIDGGPTCNTLVTAEDVICGSGVWHNRWLKLSNGDFLQPWESNVQFPQLVKGQQYKIGYEIVKRDGRHDNAVICAAMPPDAEAIRITCIEAVTATTTH